LLLFVSISGLSSGADLFSNSFLVKFRRDVNQEEAHEVASRHGFVNMGQVSAVRTAVRPRDVLVPSPPRQRNQKIALSKLFCRSVLASGLQIDRLKLFRDF
jgi:hypothetical protein